MALYNWGDLSDFQKKAVEYNRKNDPYAAGKNPIQNIVYTDFVLGEYAKQYNDYLTKQKTEEIKKQTEQLKKQNAIEDENTSQIEERTRRANVAKNLFSSQEKRGEDKSNKSNLTGGVLNRLRVARMQLGTPGSDQGTTQETLGTEEDLYGKRR